MKKSELYKFAQLCVVRDTEINGSLKLEIIRELQHEEEIALYVEKRDAEESLKKAAETEKRLKEECYCACGEGTAERGDTENAENGK